MFSASRSFTVRSVIRLLPATFLLLGFIPRHLAAQTHEPPTLLSVLNEDLRDGLPDGFESTGDPKWSPREVLLTPGASIGRQINAGSWVELGLQLPAAKVPTPHLAFNIRISFRGASDCRIAVSTDTNSDTPRTVFSLLDIPQQSTLAALTGRKPKPTLIRESGSLNWKADRLTVSYRYGQVRVSAGDGDLLVGYLDNRFATVSGFHIESATHPLTLQSLSLKAIPNPFGRLSESQQKQLAEAARIDRGAKTAFFRGQLPLPDAVSAVNRVREIHQRVLGKFHPNYTGSVETLALLHMRLFNFGEALRLHTDAVETNRAIYGDDHFRYSRSLHSLAEIMNSMGKYDTALSLYRTAMRIEQRVLGDQHEQYSISLLKLAAMQTQLGRPDLAEPLQREVVDIRGRTYGKDSLRYAVALGELGKTYITTGDYTQAESLLQQVYDILSRNPDTPLERQLAILNDLALLNSHLNQPAEAERIADQTRALINEHNITGSPAALSILNNLATYYLDLGRIDEATSLLESIVESRTEQLGSDHHITGSTLANLAIAYAENGNTTVALETYDRALRTLRDSLGTDHRDYLLTAANRAGVLMDDGQYQDAFLAYADASLRIQRILARNSIIQSERQQRSQQSRDRGYLNGELSAALDVPSKSVEAVESLWRWKGSVTRRQSAYRQVSDNPVLAPRLVELQEVTRELSLVTSRVPEPPGNAATSKQRMEFAQMQSRWKARFSELTRQREDIEKQIAASSKAFRASQADLTVAAVQERLPPRTVLIDFLEYERRLTSRGNRNERFEKQFLACVVRPTGPPVLITLGSAATLAADVEAFRMQFHRRNLSPSDRAATAGAARRLRTRLWVPLQNQLGDATTVIICPDTILGTLPFSALPGSKPGEYLIEEYRLVRVPFAHLLPDDDVKPPGGRLVLAGDIDYGAEPEPAGPAEPAEVHQENLVALRGNPEHSGRWEPLDGFREELQVVSELHRRRFGAQSEITTLTGAAATESALLEHAAGTNLIHVITHGFFSDGTIRSLDQLSGSLADQRDAENSTRFLSAWVPGMLSGLVMAGANSRPGTDRQSDGILRAAEIEATRLTDVDLVVLSACQTGLGAVAGGEGLTGLQRAFQVAGARSVVASLWQVEDVSTQELMKRFYTNLWHRKMSKIDALRDAQLWLLKHPDELENLGVTNVRTRGSIEDLPAPAGTTPGSSARKLRSDPLFWAAFQLSGDWR